MAPLVVQLYAGYRGRTFLCVSDSGNMENERTNFVAARGRSCDVLFARDASGRMHAAEFLEDGAPLKDLRRLRHWFQVMADEGRIRVPTAFKHERGSIFAFKSSECCVPCFQEGKAWFLTHGFLKKKSRWPEVEFRRAERIRTEHVARGMR